MDRAKLEATMTIFLSAPLFSAAEAQFNLKLRDVLVQAGFDVFLPQEIVFSDEADIFRQDVEAVRNCDLLLAIVDGTDVDSGVGWEIGFAYSLGKPIVALRTDFRRRAETRLGGVNLMIVQSASKYVEVEGDVFEAAVEAVKNHGCP
ncbi:MAG: nucleoside 2-deoxyribosyltransferase [Desulfatibacillum sp.]|nr:nucleoside 2-deoxyribosyltransferase [Desulfatibacillum sp.]